MTDNQKEQIIVNLIKIENVLSKLYARFASKDNFSAPVKKFWATIAEEEKLHADILNKISQAIQEEQATVSIDVKVETLKGFILKINEILKKVSSEDLTEADAYSLGATIEMELDEAGFTKSIDSADEKLKKLLKSVENDTKKHRVMLVNYSRGIR